jgi:hypothetical protein
VLELFLNKNDYINLEIIHSNKKIIPKNIEFFQKLMGQLKNTAETSYLTFLIDKWHGMTEFNSIPASGMAYFKEFFDAYNIPIGKMEGFNNGRRFRFPNFFTGEWIASDTFYCVRQPPMWGCQCGLDDRTSCEKYSTCNAFTKKKKCALHKNNIWVQEKPSGPFRLSQNYLKIIKENTIKSEKVPISPLLKLLYKNKRSLSDFVEKEKEKKEDLFLRFKKDFKLSDEEINACFNLNK